MSQYKRYCNIQAKECGLDPAGSAGHFDAAVLVETSLPWKRNLYEKAGALPQESVDLLALWRQRYEETGVYGHRPLIIAPDKEYSRPGQRRVLYYHRDPGPIARYQKIEYLAPEAEAGPLVWALFENRNALPTFEQYRVSEADDVRDILVCTHGTIDVACARFGYPLYQHLRNEYAGELLRVWRVSHFGGHVFAPTLMEMPSGHYWAYVGEEQADQIITGDGDVADLRGHYRGWAGIPHGFAQAAERELWQREGWAWFDYAKACTEVARDPDEENPRWAELCIDFTRPDGVRGSYEVRVEVEGTVETRPSSDDEKTYHYPQYTVTRLEQTDHSRAGAHFAQ